MDWERSSNGEQKHTQGSTGIWEIIRRFFAVDPNRSNGVPVKNFRNPPPGGLDPTTYDDATTVPAADIADNPYWRRDVRRNYPKLSTITQSDAVSLLTIGSAANPSPKLLAGEEGSQQLVAVQQEAQKGLSAYFNSEPATSVLGEGGLPPFPAPVGAKGLERYELGEQSYEGR